MATTIQIDDTARPTRDRERTATGFSNGIYPYRSQSRTSSVRGRRGSFDRRRSGDQEPAVDEDPGLRHAGDFKKKQVRYDSVSALATASHVTRSSLGKF